MHRILSFVRPLERHDDAVRIRPAGFLKLVLILPPLAAVIGAGLVTSLADRWEDRVIPCIAVTLLAAVLVAAALCRGLKKGVVRHGDDPAALRRAGL